MAHDDKEGMRPGKSAHADKVAHGSKAMLEKTGQVFPGGVTKDGPTQGNPDHPAYSKKRKVGE